MLRLLVVLAALVLVNPWLASGVARGDDETRRGVVIYVNHLNAPGGNGQSWAQALPDLQAALAMAAPGDEIWVRHGIYKPTTGTDLTASFVVPNGVSLFGGFDGVETERAQADPLQNETILTGDLLGNDAENFVNYADNSRHIMLVHGVDNSTIIDGFVIRSGNSTLSGSGDGAAIFASPGSPLIRNCQFRENSSLGGGALAFVGPTPTAARLIRCTFSNNRATTRAGGAVAISGNHAVVVDTCQFDGNSTLGNLGGGIAVSDSDVQIFNSTFTGNSSANGGGGVSVRGGQGLFTGTVLIAGCLFHDNLADNGGAVRWLRSVNTTYSVNLDVINCTITKNHAQNLGGGFVSGVPHQINNLRIINCIVFGNTASGATTVEQAQIATNDVGDPARIQVHSSIVEGWSGAITSTATVGTDPAFVDPLNDNFRVHSTSPAIDSGDNTFAANLLTVDIAGFNRVYDQPSIPRSDPPVRFPWRR